MSGIGIGTLANAGPTLGRVIRTVQAALGISDGIEDVVETIERHMPRALEIASEFARAEMLKAQAQMLTAEATLVREYRELLRVQLEIMQAETQRHDSRAEELRQRHQQMQKALEDDVNETMIQVLRILDHALKTHVPNYVDSIEQPLLQLMPPSKAS